MLVFFGRPAGARARHLQRLLRAVDGRRPPPGGRIITCELSDEHADFAQRHIDAARTPTASRSAAGRRSTRSESLDGPFDLVFIDADKGGYAGYFDAVVPKLAPNGLIAVDNTLWSGRVADPSETEETTEVMRAFNDKVRDDPRVVSVMLTVRDGVTLIRRR